jgi:hypothetical protein
VRAPRATGWQRPVVLAAALLAACGTEPVPPVPVALVLTASDTITATGGQLAFTVVAVDSLGAPVSTAPVAWSVSAPRLGVVTAAGAFTATDTGRGYARARLATPPARRVGGGAGGRPRDGEVGLGGRRGGRHDAGPRRPRAGYRRHDLRAGGAESVPTWSAALVALSESGTVRWSRTLSPVNANYVVVTPGVERLWVVSQSLYLFTPSGDLLWDSLTGAPDAPDFLGGSATTSLLVAAQGKHLATYRAADHTLLWETPFAPLSDWLVPATITAQEEVLAKRTEDTLFVFDATDGRVLRFSLDPDSLLDKRVFGTGTVPVGDRYYLPTANRLAAYDTAGPLLWLTEALARRVTEPAVGPDGTLYIQNRTHGLGALKGGQDGRDGKGGTTFVTALRASAPSALTALSALSALTAVTALTALEDSEQEQQRDNHRRRDEQREHEHGPEQSVVELEVHVEHHHQRELGRRQGDQGRRQHGVKRGNVEHSHLDDRDDREDGRDRDVGARGRMRMLLDPHVFVLAHARLTRWRAGSSE